MAVRDCALGRPRRDAQLHGPEGRSGPTRPRAPKTLRFARDTSRDPPLPLDRCPWCGTKFSKHTPSGFTPEHRQPDKPAGASVRQADAAISRERRHLPIVAVDEPIYERLPAFMIATADKFAAMPWSGETAGFFRGGDPSDPRPPDLIIQDELHLISGRSAPWRGSTRRRGPSLPALIDGRRSASEDHRIDRDRAPRPKADSCLFGRSSVAVFPAPGIDRRDSFFARTGATDRK